MSLLFDAVKNVVAAHMPDISTVVIAMTALLAAPIVVRVGADMVLGVIDPDHKPLPKIDASMIGDGGDDGFGDGGGFGGNYRTGQLAGELPSIDLAALDGFADTEPSADWLRGNAAGDDY